MRTFARSLVPALVATVLGGSTVMAQATMEPQKGATMSTTIRGSADSVYAVVKSRLTRLHYRLDRVDDAAHQLVVRAPKHEEKVAIAVVPSGDSASVSVTPIGAADMASSMDALIRVTGDATSDAPASKP